MDASGNRRHNRERAPVIGGNASDQNRSGRSHAMFKCGNRSFSTVTLVFLTLIISATFIPAAVSAGTNTVAAFTANTTSGYAPLTVQFTDESTFKFTPGTWAWDFENNGTVDSTDQSPLFTYTNAGTYTVNLTITDNKGTSDSEIKTDYITVSEPPSPPDADFSATPRYGSNTATVTFTDLSTGDPETWAWDFGDGETSTDQNPVHTYYGAGKYTVNLTASNEVGSDLEVKAEYITVVGATTRVHIVKYDTDGTTILDEETVSYQWMEENLDVQGDGSTHYYHQGPIFENDADPVTQEMIRWNLDENTNVLTKDMGAVNGTNLTDLLDLVGGMSSGDRLKVVATDGWYKWFAYRNVYEYSAVEGPMVLCWCKNGDYVPSPYTEGMRLIWFADTSVNPSVVHAFGNWDWHEAANPAYWYYYYDAAGKHPTTTGLSGQIISELLIYTGTTAPVADFKTNLTSEHDTFTYVSGEAPLSVRFIDWSTKDPTSWAWDFDNNGITDSTEERPEHVYNQSGNYTVKLTVTNSAGNDTEIKAGCINVT